jgi:ATP-dependent DNA ligase
MEAESADSIPSGQEWQFEPKWDGFRCLVFRDGSDVYLQSKSSQPLARYFPEIVEAIKGIAVRQFALDGELVIPSGNILSFDKLLLRLHPAESRIRKLAGETPAVLIVFDMLADRNGKSLLEKPLEARRKLLEQFAPEFENNARIMLSPASRERAIGEKWLSEAGTSLDGIIAKRLDAKYAPGEREAMLKIKPVKTADCVVGGFRYASKGKMVGSLLLGLYDEAGLLNHVGFCSGIRQSEKKELTRKLEELVKPPGFTGSAPGGQSRWSTERSGQWQPLSPKLVIEVSYDHFTGGRFRHGTRLLRWRPDKKPRQCTMEQIRSGEAGALKLLRKGVAK